MTKLINNVKKILTLVVGVIGVIMYVPIVIIIGLLYAIDPEYSDDFTANFIKWLNKYTKKSESH